jgi:DivIVA domain-containing protein
MPLTPADVRNKQFSTTRLRPGYDEEEVDAFLDEVEVELDRLIQENEELRAKLAESLRGGKVPMSALSSPLADPTPDMMAPEPPRPEPERRPEPPMMGMPPAVSILSSAGHAGRPTTSWARPAARRSRSPAMPGPARRAWSGTRRSGTARPWAPWSSSVKSWSGGLMTCGPSSGSTAAG